MKTFRLALMVLFLIIPSLAVSSQEEPTIYVIKQGDTLWGLSERFIKDPYYWPDMWAKNREITNPHLIVPGQKVRIYSDRIEPMPKEQQASGGQKAAAGAAVPGQLRDVAEETAYTVRGGAGYLMELDTKPFGIMVGIQHDRIIAGFDDLVYTNLGTSNGMKGGEKFTILRPEGDVKHPVTRDVVGRKMIPLGILQLGNLESSASDAKITQSFKEITPGAFLIPFTDDRRRVVALKAPTRELSGFIVESFSGMSILAHGDVVYTDVGSEQGAEVGNMLYLVREVLPGKHFVGIKDEKLPREILGALVIIETGKRTSTALIVKSIDTIYIGDKIVTGSK